MTSHEKKDKHEAHRNLVGRLRQQAADIRRLVSGLDDDAFGRRIVAGKWSLKELVCHIWRVQQVFEHRIGRMLAEDDPAIASYQPDGDADFDRLTALRAEEVLEGFLASRESFTQRLENLSPHEWHRPGRHPDYPHYDVHFQVEYMAHHEAHHIYQMFQRRTPLGRMPH